MTSLTHEGREASRKSVAPRFIGVLVGIFAIAIAIGWLVGTLNESDTAAAPPALEASQGPTPVPIKSGGFKPSGTVPALNIYVPPVEETIVDSSDDSSGYVPPVYEETPDTGGDGDSGGGFAPGGRIG